VKKINKIYFVHYLAYAKILHWVKSNILLILLSSGSAQSTNRPWVRWEIEHLFDGKLSQEYSYQKLLKSDNPSSSYSQKCLGCFLSHSV